jgi:trehalose-6-phosphate synthase
MNLTSHEYVICQEEKQSPLIMSEFAGTYGSLGCAIRVNPWDKQEVAEAIYDALTMNEEEKRTRWKELYRNVRVNSAQNFVEGFIKETKRVHEELSRNQSSQIPLLNVSNLLKEFSLSSRRLLVN